MRRLPVFLIFAACGGDLVVAHGPVGKDLPLGEVADDKADGQWGAALTCKPVPNLPALPHPQIVVSLDGLTVHLFDTTTGYDKIFAAGVGAVENGESLSYAPIAAHGNNFQITPSTIQTCKKWWTDPATGAVKPVFAGLPFLSWDGPYALHGPIDNFTAPNGGNLRRGFVSHGCIRMEAADILEVYARIKGVSHVPVRVQREFELDENGRNVGVPQKWVGAQCATDSECNYTGGYCRLTESNLGFCSAHCTASCADRAGYPGTMCIADPANSNQGICVPRESAQNADCRPYENLSTKTLSRFHQPAVRAAVCAP